MSGRRDPRFTADQRSLSRPTHGGQGGRGRGAAHDDAPFHTEEDGGFYGHDDPGFTSNPGGSGGTNASLGGWYGNQGLAGDGGFQGGGGGYGIQSHLGRPRAYGFHDNYLYPRAPGMYGAHPGPRGRSGPDWAQGYGDETGFGAPAIQRRGPKSYRRSDARIREEICEAMSDTPIDASEVEVAVVDGHVTLTGTVAHRADKRRLGDIAETIRGVEDVTNDIRIPRVDRAAPRAEPTAQARATKMFS